MVTYCFRIDLIDTGKQHSIDEEGTMSQNWSDAARRYEAAQGGDTKASFEAEAQKLQEWVDGPLGQAARHLLRASGRWIVLAEEGPDGGRTTVYMLDGQGLQCVNEASGMWTAYARSDDPARKPIVKRAAAMEVVMMALHMSHARFRDVERMLAYIMSELDRIAAQAPQK